MSKQERDKPTSRPRCQDIAGLLDHRLFKALCDPTRLAILCRLAEGRCETTVGRVAQCCPTDLSVVSRHLATLRDAGILQAEKRGKEVYYTVRCSELAATLRRIADVIEMCCPPGDAAKKGDSTWTRKAKS